MKTQALLLCGVFFAALSPSALAEEDWGDGVAIMSAEELDDHRGGFEIAGLNINFGATITTAVNGTPALTTTLTWTDVGTIIKQTGGELGSDAAILTSDQLEALGIDSDGDAGGVVIVDDSGITEIVHNLTEGALQNIVINSASGQDIVQRIDVSLELLGFELVQAELIVERFGMRLTDDMRGVMFYDLGS
ncbi:MAG: hypothetical protein ACT4OF_06805 [Caulobacteraceae bacterium]